MNVLLCIITTLLKHINQQLYGLALKELMSTFMEEEYSMSNVGI